MVFLFGPLYSRLLENWELRWIVKMWGHRFLPPRHSCALYSAHVNCQHCFKISGIHKHLQECALKCFSVREFFLLPWAETAFYPSTVGYFRVSWQPLCIFLLNHFYSLHASSIFRIALNDKEKANMNGLLWIYWYSRFPWSKVLPAECSSCLLSE